LAQDAKGRNRIIGCCAARANIVPQYKDGCLATLAGGMEKLLFQKPRSGRPKIMNCETIGRLSKEVQEPEGFSSYKEVHQWLTSCCELKVAYRTVHQWARYRLKRKLKVPRPVSEKQKAGAVEEFKKNCHL
jgi:transposase